MMKNIFNLETTTIWDFPQRGDWLTHKGDYPGNWSPYVPKNILLKYSKENELILDQFVGSGTTLIEATLLKRKAIGCDINYRAIELTKERLKSLDNTENIKIMKADAQNLSFLDKDSIDLICTHPPYLNIIKYSNGIKGDISLLNEYNFLNAIENVAKECYRVLKPHKYCAILIGDTRRNGFINPLGFNLMNIFIKQGFRIKEIIIKRQHNCKSNKYWKQISIKRNFYLIAHEYLFIFYKNF